MNHQTNLRSGGLALIVILSLSSCLAFAQQGPPPPQTPVTGTQSQPLPQPNVADQELRQLNLTPDQIQKIRAINADLKDERQAARLKLTLAQKALTEAVESPTPDEALISQRSRELADAQANVIRVRSLSEARIRQILTPDQRIRLQEIRRQNALMRREANRQIQNNRAGQEGLQSNTNSNTGVPGQNQRRGPKRFPRT